MNLKIGLRKCSSRIFIASASAARIFRASSSLTSSTPARCRYPCATYRHSSREGVLSKSPARANAVSALAQISPANSPSPSPSNVMTSVAVGMFIKSACILAMRASSKSATDKSPSGARKCAGRSGIERADKFFLGASGQTPTFPTYPIYQRFFYSRH